MIEKVWYDKHGVVIAIIEGVEMTIPDDPANRYRILLDEWERVPGNEIEPYVESVQVPSEISRRQFFQQLAVSGIISNQEAIAALAQGAIPPPLQVLVDQLPNEEAKFNAQMLIIGASVFQRAHPLVDTVRVLLGWTEEQADQFFIDAYKL